MKPVVSGLTAAHCASDGDLGTWFVLLSDACYSALDTLCHDYFFAISGINGTAQLARDLNTSRHGVVSPFYGLRNPGQPRSERKNTRGMSLALRLGGELSLGSCLGRPLVFIDSDC